LLDLPQICVIGDQSAGKSSLLTSITGVSFPEAAGICTKCPTIVRIQKNASKGITIKYGESVEQLEDLSSLRQKISDAQQFILNAHPGHLVVNKPIEIVVSGPDRVPLTLIDLPGIIHNAVGGGDREVEQMIRTWIKQENTLILLVRTANTDDETVKAIKIAKEYDPSGERTVQVFTKCDAIESVAKAKEVKKRIDDNIDLPTGAHFVICRIHGENSDAPDEMGEFTRKGFEGYADCMNVGVVQLRDHRLPGLLKEIIIKSLPKIENEIYQKMRSAEIDLQMIGWKPKANAEILSNIVDVLLPFQRLLKEQVTINFNAFAEKIAIESLKPTQEWCDKFYIENAFDPVYFEGVNAFNDCVKQVVSNFDMPAKQLMDRIKEHQANVMNNQKFLTGDVFGPTIIQGVKQVWFEYVESNHREMQKTLHVNLEDQSIFNTYNHYLEANFRQQFEYPDALLMEFCHKLAMDSSNFTCCPRGVDQHGRKFYKCDGDCKDYVLALFGSLKNHVVQHMEEHKKGSLQDQQKFKVFCAVQAYLKVIRKTFIDNVMASINRFVHEPFKRLTTKLSSNNMLLAAARENPTIIQKRRASKDMYEAM
jgi:GTP-binding protein EngB required for normal cell division